MSSSLRWIVFALPACFLILSCNTELKMRRTAKAMILDSALISAHVGISLYDPATQKFLYGFQDEKYFIPASNTKLATCYAVMKNLGDSLVGLRISEYSNFIIVTGTGDPTLLHRDFLRHPVYDYFKNKVNKPVYYHSLFEEISFGPGWSWNDYDADYMAERSSFPVFGNVVTFSGRVDDIKVFPAKFKNAIRWKAPFEGGYIKAVTRKQASNEFLITSVSGNPKTIQVPFVTSDSINLSLFADSLHSNIRFTGIKQIHIEPGELPISYVIYSQPVDSLLRHMMYRSDNFFAEQSLLMVSEHILGVMNDQKVIDTLLQNDLRYLPQKPHWVDGSGLSRYNLFTPKDMVMILNKMQLDFGMERIRNIFPTGNTGTLENYYKKEEGHIFAKTGSLTGVIALSGFIYTLKKRLLIFSVMINNHIGEAFKIRRLVEKFIEGIYYNY